MKKNLLRLLCLLIALLLLAGCGVQGGESTLPGDANEDLWDFDFDDLFSTDPDDWTIGINPEYTDPVDEEDPTDGKEGTTQPEEIPVPIDSYKLTKGDTVSGKKGEVRYVLIYNPDIYSEDAMYNPTVTTGSFASQVEVDLNKGGLEPEAPEAGTPSQGEIEQGPLFEGEADRAGVLTPTYKVGDTRTFYCGTEQDINVRMTRNFTCRYAGSYCNIWTADVQLTSAVIKQYGQEFDRNIYNQVVAAFGPARFTKNGGKVNILYYPMRTTTGGFFCTLDNWATGEVSQAEITRYGVNTDHAILHINGILADQTAYPHMKNFMNACLAHEFQHMICASNAYDKSNMVFCDVWINEAMSGYIEELLYPGAKEEGGHIETFLSSDRIHNGQSLYNFSTGGGDIGVYGSVYLYANYMTYLAGDDVFSNFHTYWRTSYSKDLTVPEALANAVSQNVYDAVDKAIVYPREMYFDTQEEAFMSKLTLAYYLELLDKEETDPACFGEIPAEDLLYNEINPAEIEGGGRIIIALSGDSYKIPYDAGSGLIYVGLNKDFEVVTDLIYN